MSVSQDDLISRLNDFLFTLARAAASVKDNVWAQALMGHGERIVQLVTRASADSVRLALSLNAVDELLRLMPRALADYKLVLHARKAGLAMRYALLPPLENSKFQHRPDGSTGESGLDREVAKPSAMSKNKEAILNFIRRTQRARAKDIVDSFHGLSQRTVKRNLKELIMSGRVQKRSEHKAVYYFAIDLN